jgi:hypothetical protein
LFLKKLAFGRPMHVIRFECEYYFCVYVCNDGKNHGNNKSGGDWHGKDITI